MPPLSVLLPSFSFYLSHHPIFPNLPNHDASEHLHLKIIAMYYTWKYCLASNKNCLPKLEIKEMIPHIAIPKQVQCVVYL